MKRRKFLKSTAAMGGLALTASNYKRAHGANDRIGAAMVGVRGRGSSLLHGFASQSDIDLKYVCDLDESVLNQRTEEVVSKTNRKPKKIQDFREALDDPGVDVLVLGTPDHWHAIPTILACQAGKDVYVEKPDGHNILEGRTMVAAAKKHGRVVQLGTQARSRRYMATAMDYIREGNLGLVRYAKAWESAKQGSIGRPPDEPVPAGVDYDLWLGPAPKRPFNPRRFHGNWRWFFDYGSGDLGNDGVHRLDYGLWALNTAIEAEGGEPLGLPRAVSAHGGKYYFDDDQEWPDTLLVTYDFPGFVYTYEMRIWSPYPYYGLPEGALVYGDQGYIVIGNQGWKAYDGDDREVAADASEDNTEGHIRNFLECVRNRERPTADLETVGHPSSLLCHIGNAAWRAGRTLRFDPETYTFLGDEEANRYLTRPEYRKPWVLPTIDAV